ncbi:MAG: histone deacetylase family protein [Gammaproteobacteria bacterium]
MTTGLLYDPIYLEHDTGPGHPETSLRLVATMQYLDQQPWFPDLQAVAPQKADRKWIETTHSADYIRHAEKTCAAGAPFLDSMDVGISRKSFDVALVATGGALVLADRIVTGKLQNGFALIRPPGHHAEKDMALGFCIFNNVSILARYLQQHHGLGKILILDWDVHHGNGTQHTFYADPSVLYISTHQYPFYPGTGSASETGSGRGGGYTLNCPMRAGSGNWEYEQAFLEKILPKIDEFKPELIIISAGFDAHMEDPLANINLTTEFFGWMTRVLMEKADLYAQGRIISLLEGGYNLQRLPECIAVHLQELSGLHL